MNRFDVSETKLVDIIDKAPFPLGEKSTFNQNVSDLARGKTPEMIGGALKIELGKVSPKYEKANNDMDGEILEKTKFKAIEEIVKEQPFGELGHTFTEGQLLETKDLHPSLTASEVVLKTLENRGVDAEELAITEPEYAEAMGKTEYIYLRTSNAEMEASLPEKTALAKKYLPLLAEKFPVINDLLIQGRNYPTEAEVEKVREFDYAQSKGTTNVKPDYPFKNNNAAMNVRSAIVEAIDSGKSFLFLGSSGYSDSPSSPYKMQLKEAERIAKQIGQLTGTDYKEIFKMAEMRTEYVEGYTVGIPEGGYTVSKIDNEWKDTGGPYYRLDLRQLRQLIDAKIFPGFKGYKKGGLVTKAQGAGYSMNYGDYGKNYT